MSRIRALETELHTAVLNGDTRRVHQLHDAIDQECEEL